MRAIILAAGKGGRLKGAIGDLPKCLTPMGDRTLLDFQLKSIRSFGVKDIVLVLGYEMDRVLERLPSYRDLKFTVVKNTDYETTNTAYSLWMARHEMTDDFLYLNGDVLFHPESAAATGPCIRAQRACRRTEALRRGGSQGPARRRTHRRDREGYPPQGRVRGVRGAGEVFPERSARPFPARLENIVDGGSKMAYFESALNGIASTEPLTAVDITDLPCVEIDFPEDLKHAQEVVLPRIEGKSRAEAAQESCSTSKETSTFLFSNRSTTTWSAATRWTRPFPLLRYRLAQSGKPRNRARSRSDRAVEEKGPVR